MVDFPLKGRRIAVAGPRQLADVTKLTTLGGRATISLEDGVRSADTWYREHG